MRSRPMLLIAGLPGAGKSSVARHVAQHFSPGLHLRVDDLRAMMVSGDLRPDQFQGWSARLSRQFVLESRAALALGAIYQAQGVTVVIDDVAMPPVLNVCYAPQVGLHRVLLMPSLEAILERLAGRGALYDATFTAAAPELHRYLAASDKAGWTVFDTSNWTVQETVERVIDSVPQAG